TYAVTISGTSGSLVHSSTIDVLVLEPDFFLTASPNSVSFVVNNSATSTIALHSIGGFSGNVSLNATSSPAGLSMSCSPAILVGSQSSICTVNSTTISSYTVTITGTSGNLSHNASIDVTVTPAPQPDFSLDANPSALSFTAGDSRSTTISLQSTGGFAGTVDLTTASSPDGLTSSCTQSSITGSQTSTCTLGSSTAGSYAVTITGASGSLVHTAFVSVEVSPPVAVPDFSLSADPAALSFVAGRLYRTRGSDRPLAPHGRNHGLLAHEHPGFRDRGLCDEREDARPVQGRGHRHERIADPVRPYPGERAPGRTDARHDPAANH